MRINVRPLDRGVVEVAEVIDYRHARAAIAKQTVNEVASDKPGPACHENVFHVDRAGCVVQTSLHRSECQEPVTCNIQFDSGLFINTQLQLGVGESPLGPNRFNGFAACGGREAVETVPRSALNKSPLRRGVLMRGRRIRSTSTETLACSLDAI